MESKYVRYAAYSILGQEQLKIGYLVTKRDCPIIYSVVVTYDLTTL